MKKIIHSVLLLLLSFSIFVTSAFAWLSKATVIRTDNINGSVLTGYFESGKGTKDDPYILSADTHVYNLAWLQYIGYFNTRVDENGNVWQPYFKLKNDIDMSASNWILPPIGTREYPFLGNFDGNSKVIRNLTVANYIREGDGIVRRPLSVTEMGNNAAIVGFFGVIGDYEDKYVGGEYGRIIDDTGKTSNATNPRGEGCKVNEVYNLFLDNLTVRTETEQSLIGLLAGYVNGSIANVGVGWGEIAVGANVRQLQDTQLAVIDSLRALSLYALVGATRFENVTWTELPAGSTDGLVVAPEEGLGGGASINMLYLAKRVSYMVTRNYNDNTRTFPLTPSIKGDVSDLDYYDYTKVGTRAIAADAKTTGGVYSLLPLTVDTTTMFKSESKTSPWITDYYNDKGNTSEKLLDANAGYFIGDSGGFLIGAEKKNSAISNAIKESESGYDIEFTRGTTFTSADFVRYKDVYKQFKTTANNTLLYGLTIKAQMVGGMRISGVVAPGGTPQYDKVTVTRTSLVGTTEYDSYDFIKGAVNFTIMDQGKDMYITALSGTYGRTSSSFQYKPFSLYSVNRSTDGVLAKNALTLIKKVYVKYKKDAQGNSTKEIEDIKYNDEERTGEYVEVYDNDLPSGTTMTPNSIYYTEIPVKPGDYILSGYYNALMNASNPYCSPTLLYLDIGANGNIGAEEGETPGGESTPEHAIAGVNFVDADKIAARSFPSTDEYPLATYRAVLKEGTTNHGGLTMQFNRSVENRIDYFIQDTSSAFTLTSYNGNPASLTLSLSNTKIAKREDN